MALPLLAGNWKMNPGSVAEALALARALGAGLEAHLDAVDVVVCPPFPWILAVADLLSGSRIGVGGQDCYWEPQGAYTGEVSATMLATCGGWVILGHSERRQYQGETDPDLARKVEAALVAGLKVIACVGEGDADNQAGRTIAVVESQVRGTLARLQAEQAPQLVVAYEPVWAIGTGRSAAPADVDRTMAHIQTIVQELVGVDPASVKVLYGGSANAANVASYLALESCSGCLVGGASLKPAEFIRMVELAAHA